MLYSHNATIYLAGRSEDKCKRAIASIRESASQSKAVLKFLKLDLADLSTIKASADEFMNQESKLDWLCNNAGVMVPPAGSKSTQGYELQMATNCLGPWLFTQLLHPVLKSTAATASANSVRVSWAGSIVIELFSPKNGISIKADGSPDLPLNDPQKLYAISKAGNLFYASEFGKLVQDENIVSTCFNPGNLRTELQRHAGSLRQFAYKFILHPAIYGAYTELYSGFSPDVTTSNNGCYIGPWGRVLDVRPDLQNSCRNGSEAGTGTAKKFWNWSEGQCKQYF
jgi:retinol dehydrogenase 12